VRPRGPVSLKTTSLGPPSITAKLSGGAAEPDLGEPCGEGIAIDLGEALGFDVDVIPVGFAGGIPLLAGCGFHYFHLVVC